MICAIEDDIDHNKVARPTHIRHNCRLSCDKMMTHFIEILDILCDSTGLKSLTSNAKKFVNQYNDLISLIESAGL